MNSPDPTQATSVETEPAQATDVFERAFDGDNLFIVRQEVAAHGSALGLTDRRSDDLMLIAQELAANAVRHGPGHGILRLWRDGDEIHCEVRNPGAAPDGLAASGLSPQPPGNVGGRGLWLVRQFSDDLRIDITPDTTTLTAVINLPPGPVVDPG
jgi:anti-sigma regulatory factor (Ser/Thr protein kinase)